METNNSVCSSHMYPQYPDGLAAWVVYSTSVQDAGRSGNYDQDSANPAGAKSLQGNEECSKRGTIQIRWV